MAYMIEQMDHPVYCLNCGDVLSYGRPDRKFCSRTCKNRWHNQKKYPDKDRVRRRVMGILIRNHDILDKLLRLGVHTLDLVTLASLGYNLNYVTAYRKSGIHNEYSCFDIHYEQTPSRIKKLVRIGLDDTDQEKTEKELRRSFSPDL